MCQLLWEDGVDITKQGFDFRFTDIPESKISAEPDGKLNYCSNYIRGISKLKL
jgi:hypothetical protein